jgi:hypothetical protein
MRTIPKTMYLTPSEIEQRILDRIAVADQLPEGSEERQTIMKEIARLRIYADAKRWMGLAVAKPGC